MALLLSLITGLAIWIVCWATGLMKSFDAFLIVLVIVLLAAAARLVTPYLPGGRRPGDEL
jgi:hypothetical protein